MSKSSYVLHREVLFEKVLNIIINKNHQCNDVWYFYSPYINYVFKVRSSTRREFEEIKETPGYGRIFKDRCSKNGFYVVLNNMGKGQFIGKCDSIIIKNNS